MAKRAAKSTIIFAAALEGYWLARRSSFSPHTVADYTLTFNRFAAYVGEKALAEISTADVQRFLDHLRVTRKLGKKTIANVWIALSSFWTWAAVELHVEHIIRGHVQQPDYRLPTIEIYSEVGLRRCWRPVWRRSPGRRAMGARRARSDPKRYATRR
jgi:site-specific recombinase XerD